MKTMKAIIKKTALGLLFVSLAFGQAIAQETPDVFFEQTCPFPVYTPSYTPRIVSFLRARPKTVWKASI